VVVEGLPFYEVLTPTTARGGRAKNIVPDSFWINVNHRFAPGKGLDDVKSLFDDLLGDEATYEIPDFAPSGSVDLDNPLLQELIATGSRSAPSRRGRTSPDSPSAASPPSTSAPAHPPKPTRTPSTPSCRCSRTATGAWRSSWGKRSRPSVRTPKRWPSSAGAVTRTGCGARRRGVSVTPV
jgi:hypothetical protein